ncbi:MAG: thiol:disulfide interchange protein DsbA/DsbL [Alysiella sp.]|uniref:thiol:disulfide interchange protein DsbA/DsbL n=1 Tax=Alysiella sp. TaxID=1872483 RepID=UPI0026DAC6FA|nr:thiol:disulfide interchange protein DsbA/DsbL [Alysiella sp.]MDO4433001.1 thiol:disulfide interchange protein DsbA/DsbL [Alysiella sp.]
MKNIKKTVLAVSLLLGLNVSVQAATQGVDYELQQPAFKQVQADNKVEVLEFFAYWCPHCADLEPVIARHVKTFAADTYFRTEHVVWEPSRDVGFAVLAAAVNQTGLKDQANAAIFQATVKERKNLGEPDVFKKWVVEQKAFDGKKLLAAYESFGAQTRAKKMAGFTEEYNIQSTPTVIVGGKYVVSFKNGYEQGMKTIDELIQKVREERGLKTPAVKPQTEVQSAAPVIRSRGVGFANAANR